MGRYVIRRLLQLIPVFFGTTFIIFAGVFMLPGDPIRALFGDRPPPPGRWSTSSPSATTSTTRSWCSTGSTSRDLHAATSA